MDQMTADRWIRAFKDFFKGSHVRLLEEELHWFKAENLALKSELRESHEHRIPAIPEPAPLKKIRSKPVTWQDELKEQEYGEDDERWKDDEQRTRDAEA